MRQMTLFDHDAKEALRQMRVILHCCASDHSPCFCGEHKNPNQTESE